MIYSRLLGTGQPRIKSGHDEEVGMMHDLNESGH